jgi:hypothetical protein
MDLNWKSKLFNMTRRDLLKLSGLATAGLWANPAVWPLKASAQQARSAPRGTARNAIMIQIAGGMSSWDTWDYKEQRQQPKDLDVRKTKSGVYLSKTLFPLLSEHTDKVSFVRSMRASELVHFNAQYHTQAGRALAPAIAKETPAFGSIIAYELDKQRRATDTFPTYFSANTGHNDPGTIGPGFLPAKFSGFDLFANKAFEIFGGKAEGADKLEKRWNLLSNFKELAESERSSLGDKESEYKAYYSDAMRILTDPRWTKVFETTEEDRLRYGAGDSGGYGYALLMARNLLAADAGTRFLYIDEKEVWDQHTKIFDRSATQNHYVNCVRWDKGFVALLTDLEKMPGHEPGKSMLDETLIVAGSEFGRTPEINPVAGRHHWRMAYTFMFAGGGIKPGRVLGATGENGMCVDNGWKQRQQPYMDNAVATIYSALGIDWRKRIENTPSGRAYDYVQTAPLGASEFQSNEAIDELFA